MGVTLEEAIALIDKYLTEDQKKNLTPKQIEGSWKLIGGELYEEDFPRPDIEDTK